MKYIIHIILLFSVLFICSCGVKGDPVPATETLNLLGTDSDDIETTESNNNEHK